MECFQFSRSDGRAIKAFGSAGATAVPLFQPATVSVVTIYLEPGGLLGMHPAVVDQLFLVAAGGGQAKASGESCQLSTGTAVLWRKGEEHETRAGPEGLTAFVFEGEDLALALVLRSRKS